MPRVGLGGPGMPVQRLDAHPPHQGGHVLAPDGHPAQPQQISEYPAPGAGMLQVQLVELAHQGQVPRADRAVAPQSWTGIGAR